MTALFCDEDNFHETQIKSSLYVTMLAETTHVHESPPSQQYPDHVGGHLRKARTHKAVSARDDRPVVMDNSLLSAQRRVLCTMNQ
jgi:hypothetical protein